MFPNEEKVGLSLSFSERVDFVWWLLAHSGSFFCLVVFTQILRVPRVVIVSFPSSVLSILSLGASCGTLLCALPGKRFPSPTHSKAKGL